MIVRVTFGQRFAREQHPLLPDAHPDGWYEMEAPDGTDPAEVHALLRNLLGENWSMAYPPENWNPAVARHFHRGCLGTIPAAERAL